MVGMESWLKALRAMPVEDQQAAFRIYEEIKSAYYSPPDALEEAIRRVEIRRVEAGQANESGMEEAAREYEEAMAAQEAFNGEA